MPTEVSEVSGTGKFVDTENRKEVARSWGGMNVELLFTQVSEASVPEKHRSHGLLCEEQMGRALRREKKRHGTAHPKGSADHRPGLHSSALPLTGTREEDGQDAHMLGPDASLRTPLQLSSSLRTSHFAFPEVATCSDGWS